LVQPILRKKMLFLINKIGWFNSQNMPRIPMYDMETGRCFDGILGDLSVNLNSGAESSDFKTRKDFNYLIFESFDLNTEHFLLSFFTFFHVINISYI